MRVLYSQFNYTAIFGIVLFFEFGFCKKSCIPVSRSTKASTEGKCYVKFWSTQSKYFFMLQSLNVEGNWDSQFCDILCYCVCSEVLIHCNCLLQCHYWKHSSGEYIVKPVRSLKIQVLSGSNSILIKSILCSKESLIFIQNEAVF